MAIRVNSGPYLYRTNGLPSQSTYTMAGWFMRRGGGSGTWELLCGFSGLTEQNSYNYFYHRTSAGINFQIWGDTEGSLGAAVSADVWYYVALIRNASANWLRGYYVAIGDTALGYSNLNSPSTPIAGAIYLGNNGPWPVEWGNARYYNWMVWSGVALTEDELLLQRWSYKPIVQTGNLISWHPMWEGSGERTRDYSGNGYNLTESGTVTDEDPAPISLGQRIKRYWYVAAQAPAYTALRPDSDIVDGVWKDQSGGGDLYEAINEETYSDSDYIWDENAQVGDYFEVGLSNPQATVGSGDHIIRWRASRVANSLTVTVKCELRQGDTVIASDERQLTSSFQTFEYTLTAGEVASITNYNDLRLRFIITGIS